MKCTLAVVAAAPLLAAASIADGGEVQVTITGEVEFNQINPPPLGNANPGDPATISFVVDSDTFADSPNFPTRGYLIAPATYTLTLGPTVVGLQSPFPFGQFASFVLRDNDPAVDGFFVSTDLDFPLGVPLEQAGIFGQFRSNFSVTYTGDTLASLDLLDALGTYDFTGLTVFHWTTDDGGFEPMGMIFEQMTLELIAAPCPEDCGDGNGIVDIVDLLALLSQWGSPGPCDTNGGGAVTIADLLNLLAAWGPCP